MFNKKFYEDTDFNACQLLVTLRKTAEDYSGECGTLAELSEHAYNEDYKYIYYKDAERALQNAGVFDCFQIVHDYLMEVVGEDNTDYSNPVDVANLLFYIQGERITQAVAEWLGVDVDEELDNENWNKLFYINIKSIIPYLDDFN